MLFTFPLRYLFTIGHLRVFSLGKMVLPASGRISRVPPYSGANLPPSKLRLRDYHPLWYEFPHRSAVYSDSVVVGPTTPPEQALMVWANPRSLAATEGITIVFCSSGY